MRTLDGRITMLVSEERTSLSIVCNKSGNIIVNIELTPQDFCAIMGRQSYRPCKMEVLDSDRMYTIGSKMVMENLKFEMPEDVGWKDRQEVAREIAKKVCPEGWESDSYFGSQGSFFTKEGKSWAQCTIRKYVPEEVTP